MAIEPLIKALKHGNKKTGEEVAAIIRSKTKWDPEVLDRLAKELKDKNPQVRDVSAEVLLAHGRNVEVPSADKVTVLLSKEKWTVEEMAKIGNAAAGPLIKLLNTKGPADWRVVIALGYIGNSKAVDPLIKLLKNQSDQLITQYIIESLGKIGDPKAI